MDCDGRSFLGRPIRVKVIDDSSRSALGETVPRPPAGVRMRGNVLAVNGLAGNGALRALYSVKKRLIHSI